VIIRNEKGEVTVAASKALQKPVCVEVGEALAGLHGLNLAV
jgi:hypothetical protein